MKVFHISFHAVLQFMCPQALFTICTRLCSRHYLLVSSQSKATVLFLLKACTYQWLNSEELDWTFSHRLRPIVVVAAHKVTH